MMETWQTNLSPAPWRGDHGEIYDAKDNVVVFMAVDGERFNHANESLIASAPELLNSLIAAIKSIRTGYYDYDSEVCEEFLSTGWFGDAVEAINKATGRREW